jgi:CRP-like cAMP-binding protein
MHKLARFRADDATASHWSKECLECRHRESNPICSEPKALDRIQRERISTHYKAGQIIFYQGNVPLGIYVIQSGLVKIVHQTEDGADHTLRILGPGQALGYRSLLSDEVYNGSGIAIDDVSVCFISKSLLFSIAEEVPAAGLKLMVQLSRDLRLAEEKWITQVDRGASERVAEALLFLNEYFHGQPWTRREIAQWAGTTPETVMRTLAQLVRDGLIECDNRLYKILDAKTLSKKAYRT